MATLFANHQLPDKTLLAKNERRTKNLEQGIRAGWDKGIQQAYSIFQQNIARLKRIIAAWCYIANYYKKK